MAQDWKSENQDNLSQKDWSTTSSGQTWGGTGQSLSPGMIDALENPVSALDQTVPEMPRQYNCAQQLKEEREQQPWSQEELALKICATVSMIQDWENGISTPDTDFLLSDNHICRQMRFTIQPCQGCFAVLRFIRLVSLQGLENVLIATEKTAGMFLFV
jgi:DNA-binding XRE family transcriptional regulator